MSEKENQRTQFVFVFFVIQKLVCSISAFQFSLQHVCANFVVIPLIYFLFIFVMFRSWIYFYLLWLREFSAWKLPTFTGTCTSSRMRKGPTTSETESWISFCTLVSVSVCVWMCCVEQWDQDLENGWLKAFMNLIDDWCMCARIQL